MSAMKTFKYICLIASILGIVACSKESGNNQEPQESQEEASKTITFGTVINWNVPSKAELSTSDWNIHWNEDDVIAVANNYDNVIHPATIQRNPSDYKQGTFTIDAVDGATVYYAYYPYSASLTFDHTTATFSNASLDHTVYGVGELTNANAMAMAGKTEVSGTEITFKPCLAIVAFTMAANSTSAVPVGYDAISGVRFAQSSTSIYGCPNSAGSYSVDLSSSDLAVTATGVTSWPNNVIDVLPSGSSPLSSSDTYYFPIIPGGDVNGMIFKFFTVGNGETTDNNHDLANAKNFTISPGEYLEVGPLDPVAKKKALAEFSPAITIDGDMSDWTSVSCSAAGDTGAGTDAVHIIKAKADEKYIYVYLDLDDTKLYTDSHTDTYANRSYLYVGDGSAGSYSGSYWSGSRKVETKVELWIRYKGDPTFTNWNDAIDQVGTASSGDHLYFEVRVVRSKISSLKKGTDSKAYVGFYATDKYNGGPDASNIGYAPANGAAMLEVDVPNYSKW